MSRCGGIDRGHEETHDEIRVCTGRVEPDVAWRWGVSGSKEGDDPPSGRDGDEWRRVHARLSRRVLRCGPGGRDRGPGIARFSLLAAEAREVCEAQNWGRLRDIWREFRGLVPLRFVSTVWRETCGESVAWGENRWTPVGPDVEFSISLPFESVEPPRIVFGDANAPRADVGGARGTVAWIERSRSLRPGSAISVAMGGRMIKAAADGLLVVATRVGSIDPGAPCEVIRPVEFRLDLQGDGWSGRLELVEDFDGNRVIETDDGFEMLGMLVRIDLQMDDPIAISSVGIFDEAFLQVPLERGPGGSIRLGGDQRIDGLELLPVDPRLESIQRADPIGGLQGSGVDCGVFARSRAEAFLDLHPDCRPAPAIVGPVED